MSVLFGLSRLLGLVRELCFAALLGAGVYADAFNAAFRIPNLVRDLFAEGALSAALVPTYARARAESGEARAFQLASRLLTLLAVALGALIVLGYLFTDPVVSLLAPGFALVPGKQELTVQLTRVMLPFLPLVSFAAVAMGVLNAHGRFGTPAFAPAIFNLVTIVWAAGLWLAGFGPAQVALGWAVGTLAGGAAQFLIQVPGLRGVGWRYRAEWAPGDPGIRSIARLMAPATIGLAAVQLNVFISTNFASHEPGAVSWLQYAFRILYVPIGLFGVAVGTVVTADYAHQVAAEDMPALRDTLRRSLHMLSFLTFPASVGLFTLAEPIVRLLYERGAFRAGDNTHNTAAALSYMVVGLAAYAGVKVLAPAFYALGAPRLPVLGSAAAVSTNVVFILCFYRYLGFKAIALGMALGSVANVLLLLLAFERRLGGVMRSLCSVRTGKMLLSALALAPAAWGAAHFLEARFGTRGLLAQVVTGLGPVLVGGLAYVAAAWLLRVPELATVQAAVVRWYRRSP